MTKTLVCSLTLLLSTSAVASPPEGVSDTRMRHRAPPIHLVVKHRGDEIGLDQSVLNNMQDIVDANKEAAQSLRDRMSEARSELQRRFAIEPIDETAIRAQSERIDALHSAVMQHRLDVDLQLRALLTAEQWEALRNPPKDRRERGAGRP